MKAFYASDGDHSHPGQAALPISDSVLHRILAANTAESIAVPTGAKLVVLTSIGADSYAKGSGSAAVPAADVTDGSGSAPLPAGVPRLLRCGDVTTISVISSGTPAVIAEFFS